MKSSNTCCLECSTPKTTAVPLLECGHFVCPSCYVAKMQCGQKNCQCGKRMRRRCSKL